jgi:MFS family permease
MFPALLAGMFIWGMMRSVTGDVPGSASTRAYFASLAILVKKGALVVLVLVTALRSMGQTAMMTFLPIYLREDLEFTATWTAIYLSMAQIVGIGAQPAMGLISDKFGRKLVLIPAMTSLGLLYIALAYADTGAQLVLTILALGAFQYSLHTIFIASAMDIAGGEVQSTMVSLIYGASFLGTLSPILAGIIADAYGVPNTFLYAGGVTLLATFILALLKMPKTESQLAQSGV